MKKQIEKILKKVAKEDKGRSPVFSWDAAMLAIEMVKDEIFKNAIHAKAYFQYETEVHIVADLSKMPEHFRLKDIIIFVQEGGEG